MSSWFINTGTLCSKASVPICMVDVRWASARSDWQWCAIGGYQYSVMCVKNVTWGRCTRNTDYLPIVSCLALQKSLSSSTWDPLPSTLDSRLDALIFVWPSRANLTACIIWKHIHQMNSIQKYIINVNQMCQMYSGLIYLSHALCYILISEQLTWIMICLYVITGSKSQLSNI